MMQIKKERPYFEENEAIIRQLAAQGIVLLENNGALPLKKTNKNIALFGGGAIRTVFGGTGSALPWHRHTVNIYDAFKAAGYSVVSEKGLFEYDKLYIHNRDVLRRFIQQQGFSQALVHEYYRPGDIDIPDEDFDAAAKETDTAIYVLSRTIGEGWDRRKEGTPVKVIDDDFIATANDLYVNCPKPGIHDHHPKELKFARLTDAYTNSSYDLTEIEKSNLRRMLKKFTKSILLLNVGGVIDTKFIKELEGLGAVMLISYGGMEAGTAALDVLEGTVTPSGKLTDTWAERYEDNPASATFSKNDGDTTKELYDEGIYIGYRYFDTFGVKPIYEFGFGRSYTTFDVKIDGVTADEQEVTVKATVTNTGKEYTGREVVQVYFTAPDGLLEHPYQELAGFAKTDDLAPGAKQALTIRFPLSIMASYNEKLAAFILEAGDYIIRVGNSSRNTHVGAVLRMSKAAVTEQLTNQMNKGKLAERSKKGAVPYSYAGEKEEIASAAVIAIDASRIKTLDTAHNGFPYDCDDATTYIVGSEKDGPLNPADKVYLEDGITARRKHKQIIQYVEKKPGMKLKDVMDGKLTLEEFVAQLSLEQLANFINFEKFVPDFMEEYGIPVPPQYDGPAGLRFLKDYTPEGYAKIIGNEQGRGRLPSEYTMSNQPEYLYCSCYPASILIAQSWDLSQNELLGKTVLSEMIERGVNVLLAPGLNIHRDPLCGRSFEYIAEDPVLSGLMAAAATKGLQSVPGYGACIKHMALNNQEVDRFFTDSIASERTIRELYLKGFSIVMRAARPMMIMTSYNRINGEHASECFDLCTDIIRGEWGYTGLIRTDGFAGEEHDLSMYAGNEWVSYPNSYRRIIRHCDHTQYDPSIDDGGKLTEDDETIYLGDVQKCAALILRFTMSTKSIEEIGAERVPYLENFELVDYLTVAKSDIAR